MAGIPALTGIAPLPSPAVGVPASPDLLTGLLQAAPQFMQGEQTGQQMQENKLRLQLQKAQLGQQQLQMLYPFLMKDPNNPALVKRAEQAAQMMGLDPNSFLTTEQVPNSAKTVSAPGIGDVAIPGTSQTTKSINTSGLMQFSPAFKVLSDPTAMVNLQYLPAASQKAWWDMMAPGVPMPAFLGQEVTNPKTALDIYNNFERDLRSVGTGNFDPKTLMIEAEAASHTLSKTPAYSDIAAGVLDEAKNALLSPMALSKLAKNQADVEHIKQQIESAKNLDQLRDVMKGYYGAQTAVAQQRVPLIKAQTQVELMKPEVMAAQIKHFAADDAHLNAETIKAQQAVRMGGSVLSTFRAVSPAYQHALSILTSAEKDLQTARANLQNPLAQSDPATLKMYQQYEQAANQRVAKAQAVMAQIKPLYDTYLHAIQNGETGIPGQPPGGKRFGNSLLHSYMQKYNIDQATALKQAQSEGWVYDPSMP